MTDIIAEIAESGFGHTKNPINDISLDDKEDTNAVVVPDLFVWARELFTTGEPHWKVSWLVKVGQVCGWYMLVVSILQSLHILWHGYDIWMGLGDDPESFMSVNTGSRTLELLEGVFRGLAPLFYVPLASEFVSVVHPTEGHLVLLGAGTQMVSQRAVTLLKFWQNCAYAGLAGIASFMVFGSYWISNRVYMGLVHGITGQDENMDGIEDTQTTAQVAWTVIYLVPFVRRAIATRTLTALSARLSRPPTIISCYAQVVQFTALMCAVLWLFSLKVAAVLAEDSVREAAKNVTPEAIGSDERFFPLVFQPCMQLAKTQLPILSSGWGRGAFLGSSESSPSIDSLGVLTCRVALI